MKYFTFLYSITPLALALLLSGCNAEAEPSAENAANGRERIVSVTSLVVEAIPFEDRLRINGMVMALDDALISAETGGQVLFVAERGTHVKKGDIILKLDDRMLRSGYEAAKTGYQLAEDVFNRQQSLYADSVISTVQYLQAKAQRDQARSQYDAIGKQLGDANLRAPFGGRIEERLVSVGEVTGPGMPVLRLVNTSSVKITGGVPERFSSTISEGTPVEISFRSYGLENRTGTISFAGNLINPDSRTFPVEVVVSNEDERIKPRMVAEMRVLRNQIENSLVIPRTAMQRDEMGNTVFVVTNDEGRNRARVRRIETRLVSGDVVVVESGLQAGEEIVITGLSSLGDGDLLHIIDVKQNKDLYNLAQQ